jgi:hypothetical protein
MINGIDGLFCRERDGEALFIDKIVFHHVDDEQCRFLFDVSIHLKSFPDI